MTPLSTPDIRRGALIIVLSGVAAACSEGLLTDVVEEAGLPPVGVTEICFAAVSSANPATDVQACVDGLSPLLDVPVAGLPRGPAEDAFLRSLGLDPARPTRNGPAMVRRLAGDVDVSTVHGVVSMEPPEPCAGCVYYTGNLTGQGGIDVQPAGTYYYVPPGTHTAYLRGPVATNFDVFLLKYDFVTLSWLIVASARTADSDEDLVHTGARGFYVILVYSINGGGDYDFWLEQPVITNTGLVPSETFSGAGDIADNLTGCGQITAELLDGIPGAVFALGDQAYFSGTSQEYADCYDPNWGRHFARTHPSPGNHDYLTPGATGYFNYFGSRAGPGNLGYYSFDLGGWHVVSLNSEVDVSVGSPQLQWLQADLDASTKQCTLVYWHRPIWYSTSNLIVFDATREYVWRVLYGIGVDVVMAAHDHIYERFVPMSLAGGSDPVYGIQKFTVGTGGRPLNWMPLEAWPTTAVRQNWDFGVLKLTLNEVDFDWEWVGEPGGTFVDAGTGTCH